MIEPKLFKNLYNLEHRADKTYDFNLEDYKQFLHENKDPQNSIGRIIHIAGTNGKGSVAEMISSIIFSAGYRVGTYTSPHIKHVNERIKINGEFISDNSFSRIERMIYERILSREKSYRTYFEAMTMLAFIYFKERKTDFAVIETGLGGRLDSTNVVESEVSVITKIGLDHTDILGNTLKKIAIEKAGIIKKNQRVFTYKQSREALSEIKKQAKKQGAVLSIIDFKEAEIKNRRRFLFENEEYIINQPGLYQIENALLSIKTAEFLGIGINAIKRGIKEFKIEGRFEMIHKKPLIIIDGSHNPEAIKMTIEEVKAVYPKKRIASISIFMADKDFKKSLNILKRNAKNVIVTEIPFFRCAKRDDYNYLNVDFQKNVKESLIKAVKTKADLILFIGSFYLLSHARRAVREYFS